MKLLKLSFVLILFVLAWALSTEKRVVNRDRRPQGSLTNKDSHCLNYQHCNKELTREAKSSFDQPVVPSRPEPERPHHKEPSDSNTHLSSEGKVTFWSNIIVGIATAVMAIFTGLLWYTANNQLIAFQQSERAIVVPTEVRFTKPPVANDPTISITIEMKNGGKSTALIDKFSAAITHGPLPPEPVYPKHAIFALGPILPNGIIAQSLPLSFSTAWGQDYVDRLNNGTLPLYFYGLIRYHDRVNVDTTDTGFCFLYRPKGGVREPIFETCQDQAYTYTASALTHVVEPRGIKFDILAQIKDAVLFYWCVTRSAGAIWTWKGLLEPCPVSSLTSRIRPIHLNR